jgi:hypothetical protein
VAEPNKRSDQWLLICGRQAGKHSHVQTEVRPIAAMAGWPTLAARAHWLIPLALLVLLVLIKDWPPASCGKGN